MGIPFVVLLSIRSAIGIARTPKPHAFTIALIQIHDCSAHSTDRLVLAMNMFRIQNKLAVAHETEEALLAAF